MQSFQHAFELANPLEQQLLLRINAIGDELGIVDLKTSG